MYFWMHDTPIRCVTVIKQPRLSSEGVDRLDSDPGRIATAALDGSNKMVDLEDVATVFNFGFERGAPRFLWAIWRS